MSYPILYDAFAIRSSSGGVTPFILIGDSNCYESGNGTRMRRSRSWQVPFIRTMSYDGTRSSVLFAIQEYCEGYELVPTWEYHGKFITGNKLYSILEKEIDNAMTFSEFRSLNPQLYVDARIQSQHFSIKTSEDFEKFIKQATSCTSEPSDIQFGDGTAKIQKPSRKKFPEYTRVVIKSGKRYMTAYEVDGKHYRVTLSPFAKDAMVFPYAPAAENLRDKLNGKFGGGRSFVVVDAKVLDMPRYALRFTSGKYSGQYISRYTGRHFASSPSGEEAKQYAKASAVALLDKLEHRVPGFTEKYGELEIIQLGRK